MVTRQTFRQKPAALEPSNPSMEAGNGYPANVENRQRVEHALDPSMEAGNGYPANQPV